MPIGSKFPKAGGPVAAVRAALACAALAALGVLGVGKAGAADVPYRISGQGWTEVGSIVHSTDTLLVNLNNNMLQSAGAQFTAIADIGENWEGAFGIGGFSGHNVQGNDVHAKLLQFFFRNFITESRITYFRGDKAAPGFSLTFGNFDYSYNKDVKNLGLYLLRGPVYPGFLTGGFMDPAVDPTRGDILGLKSHLKTGLFTHDLIFANERQFPPSFDWSLAYVAKFNTPAFTFGAGVNFHRILSANSDLTTPSVPGYYADDSLVALRGGAPYDHRFTEGRIDTLKDGAGAPILDSTGKVQARYVPTLEYTHRGVKLMGMFSFDPKAAFGLGGAFGPEDLKIYGEAALIGVKNYGTVYAKRSERVPVMGGFNIPAFGFLDVLSFEVEWYGARYRNDIAKLGPSSTYSQLPSPVPVSYRDYAAQIPEWKDGVDPVTGFMLKDSVDGNGAVVNDSAGNPIKVPGHVKVRGTGLDIQNLTTDNIKWSLFAQKTVRKHIRFTAQVANDHYRPTAMRGVSYKETGGTSEASTTLSDWYFMFRLGYFF